MIDQFIFTTNQNSERLQLLWHHFIIVVQNNTVAMQSSKNIFILFLKILFSHKILKTKKIFGLFLIRDILFKFIWSAQMIYAKIIMSFIYHEILFWQGLCFIKGICYLIEFTSNYRWLILFCCYSDWLFYKWFCQSETCNELI